MNYRNKVINKVEEMINKFNCDQLNKQIVKVEE